MNKVKLIFYCVMAAIMIALCAITSYQASVIKNYKDEMNRLSNNFEAVTTECTKWRTKDSLSVAKNKVLELKIDELERIRGNQVNDINALKKRNEDLNSLVVALSEMNVKAETRIEEKIIYVDSSAYKVRTFCWNDEWVDIDGVIYKGKVDLTVNSKDELLITNTVEYKRFLGFLWKTKKIKSQNVTALSKNPHNTITDIEQVNITK